MIKPQQNRTIIIISIITIIAGILVMLGWVLNIPLLQQIVPGFAAMAFNVALCIVLLAYALLFTQYPQKKYSSQLFTLLSLFSTLIGAITLLEYLFNINTGFDQLFVTDRQKLTITHLYPGRMAFSAVVCVVLLGSGFLLLTAKRRLFRVIAQFCFHFVTILSAIALIGYLYGVSLFYTVLYVSSMATHTAILFFILSLGACLLNPSIGIARLFTGKRVGNQMAKRIFGLTVLMVLVFGSLRLQTPHSQLFSLDVGISLLAVCFLLISLAIIWDAANWLNRIDIRRSAAEAEVKLMNTDLEKIVKERTEEFRNSEEKYRSLIEHASDAIYVLDFNGDFVDVNASMCKMTGYTREELLKLNVEAIIDPEELKTDPLRKVIKNPEINEFRERKFMRKNGQIFNVEINVKRFSANMTLVIARDITDRKKMETELKDAELKFRTIAEKSMVGVYIVKGDRFVYVNPRFAAVFGYQPEELTNTVPVEAIIQENYKHITTENVRKRMTGEVESTHYEIMGQRKDGSTNWVEFYGSRATIGDEPAIIGSMIDITERKHAEDELRSSELKYKLLFESNPLPLWMISKEDMTIIAVNDVAADLYGYTKEELINNTVRIFRQEEDFENQLEGYRRDINVSTDRGIVKHLKKDGTVMHVQLIAHDIIFDGKQVRLSLTNDITEKLKAEESLKKSEANLQTILKTTDTAYALVDLDLTLLAFNQKAIEFVKEHYNHIPEKGERLADFFPVERFPRFIEFIGHVLRGQHIYYEIDYPQVNGAIFWYDVRLSPLTNDNKEILGMLMALYDITERKNAEQDLKSAYERIQDHIESIKGMAWKQSHLVRSPLANLKALAEMLKSHPSDAEVLEHFQVELNRLDAIIHEMAAEAAGHEM